MSEYNWDMFSPIGKVRADMFAAGKCDGCRTFDKI